MLLLCLSAWTHTIIQIEGQENVASPKIGQGVAVVALTSLLFSGCSQVVKTGANVALGFSENIYVPPILAMEDAGDGV